MADFYALLKQSIIERGITDSGERDEIYAQARQAMIRRLWEVEPPLDEDEIEQRIGVFDVAVSDIEGDIMATFAAEEEPEPEPEPPPRPSLPALRQPFSTLRSIEPAYAPRGRTYANGHDRGDERAYADRGSYAAPAPVYAEPEDDYARGDPDEYAYEQEAQRIDAYDEEPQDDDGYEEESVVVPAAVPPRPKLPRPPPRSRQQQLDLDDYAAPRPRREAEIVRRKPRRKGFLHDLFSSVQLSEADKVRVLAGAVGLLAVVLIGTGVYFILPHDDDGVTVDIGVHREVSDAATAVRVAAQQVPIDQTFMLFDGRDPTVFETSADNPVRFDAQNGVVRISSSTSSPG